MSWFDEIRESLTRSPVIGYAPDTAPATEPTALAALVLIASGERTAATAAIEFLNQCQGEDGSVGIRQDQPSPGWPTSLAILAWLADKREEHQLRIRSAVDWILQAKGKAQPQSTDFGHNTELVAWSWADNTHSWIEPTALHVLALRAAGHVKHPRTREGVQMLLDRQLPAGGCNYGNTSVLGQMLRPHLQPTGIALLALAGEPDSAGRIDKSLAYLRRTLGVQTTATSLAWGLLGLAAHKTPIPTAEGWLAAAYQRVQAHDHSPHKLALLALASLGPALLTPSI